MGWGVDGGWMPLPTCLQQYCDPASLVCEFAAVGRVQLAEYGAFIQLVCGGASRAVARRCFWSWRRRSLLCGRVDMSWTLSRWRPACCSWRRRCTWTSFQKRYALHQCTLETERISYLNHVPLYILNSLSCPLIF